MTLPSFVPPLVQALRRRGLPLGVDDLQDLRVALLAGFGLSSTEAFQELCVSLWAKSPEEAATVRAVFARTRIPVWTARLSTGVLPVDPAPGDPVVPAGPPPLDPEPPPPPLLRPVTGTAAGAPPRSGSRDPALLLVPQYPVSERAVAQVWRRLRRRVRSGPATVLDVTATVDRRARTGVAVAPVLVPPRRNAARLLLLVDRDGSMAPYHGYVDHVTRAIRHAARLDVLTVVYFHDVPGHGDRAVLADTAPDTAHLDAVLPRVEPLVGGTVYADPALAEPVDLAALLERVTPTTAVAVVSDAGAARGSLDTTRLLDVVALAKAVTQRRATLAWLNPVPRARWRRTTAALIARHVPMHALDLPGMYRAVDALRGRHPVVERPL
ncbi:VWA domain-containing protein [Asanoa siamensis]|uniref:VWA domain containing CoxE-like protein n=1 Tax=Asanoa siamensis TaxID=926357 RepID=A0ABQ4CV71_9ACTN|nr:VWA domain-containing protein [Asanoa siamensis]GIF75193.1 hypothetical protein Asi02nite_47110 [Asanoa siamensis]